MKKITEKNTYQFNSYVSLFFISILSCVIFFIAINVIMPPNVKNIVSHNSNYQYQLMWSNDYRSISYPGASFVINNEDIIRIDYKLFGNDILSVANLNTGEDIWQLEIINSADYILSTLQENYLYISNLRTTSAIDLEKREVVWQFELGNERFIGLQIFAITNEYILLKLEETKIAFLTFEGTLSEEINYDAEIFGYTPNSIITIADNNLISQSFFSQEINWSWEIPEKCSRYKLADCYKVYSNLDDRNIYIHADGNLSEFIYMLDSDTGQLVWENDVSKYNGIASNIASDEDKVYFYTWEDILIVLDKVTGSLIDTVQFETEYNPISGFFSSTLTNHNFIEISGNTLIIYFGHINSLQAYQINTIRNNN